MISLFTDPAYWVNFAIAFVTIVFILPLLGSAKR